VAVGGQRGVALLLVLGLLALLGTVVADFQFQSRIDLQLAYNARDELQAEANALSALRMRALMLKQSRKLDSALKGLPGVPPLGQLLEQIPVECGLMSAITKQVGPPLDAPPSARGPHGHTEESQDFFPGECNATSQSEHAKISINLLRTNIQNRAQIVGNMLLGLLADPRLRHFFDEDDRNGQHAESPLALVQAITDWIDSDHTEAGNLGDEDRRYQYLKEPYRAKNAPFDSVAELQLVFGVSDALYKLLKKHVTVYTDDPTMELSTAPLERILYWGLPACLKDGVPVTALAPALPMVAQRIMLMRAAGGVVPFTVQALTNILQQAALTEVIDQRKLNQYFSDSTSTTWYTLESEGRMGNATRRIRAVFQASEGQFYYARVE
jgi:general secretion pathway protein K